MHLTLGCSAMRRGAESVEGFFVLRRHQPMDPGLSKYGGSQTRGHYMQLFSVRQCDMPRGRFVYCILDPKKLLWAQWLYKTQTDRVQDCRRPPPPPPTARQLGLQGKQLVWIPSQGLAQSGG